MKVHAPESDPVIVVGAGLAGLTAAYSLRRAGLPVVILEARGRVGGRLHTDSGGFESDQYGELGAELIYPGSTAFAALCRELSVKLSEPVQFGRPGELAPCTALEGLLSFKSVITGGEKMAPELVETVCAEANHALDNVPPVSHETVAQWSRRANMSEIARAVLAGACRALAQQDPARTDAHVLTRPYVGSARRVVGGAQKLAHALSGGLDVRVDAAVASVRQRRGRITVSLENGDTFSSGHAIIAVPPLVLGTIGFEPPLAAATAVAATSSPRAHGGKVVAQYREGAAVRAALVHGVVTDGVVNSAWVSNAQDTSGPAIVSGLVCGAGRASLERDNSALAALDTVVRTVVGEPVSRTHGSLANWSADPYSLGIGGLPPASLRGERIAIMAALERRVHFAGAHTDESACDTVEGAVRSGVRAAAEVLRHPVRVSIDECNTKLVTP